MERKFIILGGGVTGLVLGRELLKRTQYKVVIIERESACGGLAGSVPAEALGIDKPILLDLGSHRVHEQYEPRALRLVQELLGPDLLTRPRRGRIRIQGRFLDYPPSPLQILGSFGLLDGARIARDYAWSTALQLSQSTSSLSFEDYVKGSVGNTLYEKFYKPYAMKLWGMPPKEISFEPARSRVLKFRARAVLNDARKRLAKHKASSPADSKPFFYPREGFSQIARKLTEDFRNAGGELLLNTSVQGFELGPDRRIDAVLVEAKDGTRTRIPAETVASTLSIETNHRLVRLSDNEPDKLELSWRSLRLLYLRTWDLVPSPHETHYFPEQDVIFGRLSEPAKYSPEFQLGPGQGELAVCEVPCSQEDPTWKMPERDFAEACIRDLRKIGILKPTESSKPRLLYRNIKNLYPIQKIGWRREFDRAFARFREVGNLYCLGRPAHFIHCNVDHCMSMALQLADLLADSSSSRDDWERVQSGFAKFALHD